MCMNVDLQTIAAEARQNEEDATRLTAGLSAEQANWRPNESQWSVWQRIDHLARVHWAYVPALQESVHSGVALHGRRGASDCERARSTSSVASEPSEGSGEFPGPVKLALSRSLRVAGLPESERADLNPACDLSSIERAATESLAHELTRKKCDCRDRRAHRPRQVCVGRGADGHASGQAGRGKAPRHHHRFRICVS